MRKLLLLSLSTLLMFFISVPAFAQKGHNVSLTLLENGSEEPLGFATVSITVKNATRVYKYSLTDENGNLTFDDVRNATYILKAELMGYINVEREFVVKDGDVKIGKVYMDLDRQALDAASVTAAGNPVVIKKDTVEYNASSFKTTENDVLEDLLKKLPGVEVGSDGTITANGQTITRIYIDGKEYFTNDPTLASKNLPAKIVDKVRVVKKKSDQAEFTGIEDGEESTVLDLSVQKGMMNGIMGNLRAGVGHDAPVQNKSLGYEPYNDNRFSSNLFLGNFSTGAQFSIIGNANNANNRAFGGDRMGGMGGGRGNGGVTTSYMIGGNIGYDLFDNKMELTGDYSYDNTNTDSWNKTYQEQYYDSFNRISNNQTASDRNEFGHTVSMRIKHDFSKSSSLIVEPSLTLGQGDYSTLRTFDSKTYDKILDLTNPTNDGFSFNGGQNKNYTASARIQYRQRLGIPGRTLVMNSNLRFSDNITDGFNQSLTNSYLGGKQSVDIINQRTTQDSKSQNASLSVNYTEPMGNFFYLEGTYSVNWSRSDSNKDAFDGLYDITRFSSDLFNGYNPRKADNPIYNATGEVRNLANSNDILNENLRQTYGVEVLYQSTKLRMQAGFNLIPTRIHNYTERSAYNIDTTYTNVNWSPTARVIWDAGDNLNIRFNYRGNTSQPSVSQLVPVLDNTNPTSLSLGNPYLNPYFTHNINSEYRFSNRQKFRSMNLRLNGGFTQDPVVNATWTSKSEGRTYSMPVNGPVSGNFGANFSGNTPIKRSNFTLMGNAGFNGSRSSSFQGTSVETSKYLVYDNDGSLTDFDYLAFRNDYPVLNDSKDFNRNDTKSLSANGNFTLQYRNDALEVRVGANTSYSRSSFSLYDTKQTTWRNGANASFTWTWDETGLSMRSDFNYRWYGGTTMTNVDDEAILNAEISKLIFNQRATIALNAYDLLGQSKGFTVTDSGNGHSEVISNTLGRYIMLTFTWRFGTFGGGRGGRGGGRGGMGGGMPMGGGMGGFGGGMF